MGTQEKDIAEEEEEEDEGPPPGFQCLTSQTEEQLVKQEKVADINENNINENNEDDEDIEGPPPGWSSIPPATHQPFHPSDVGMSDKIEEVEDEEGPPPGWHSVPLAPQLAEALPADAEMESYEDRTKGADEGFQPAQKSVPPPKLLPPTPPPPAPAVSTPLGGVVVHMLLLGVRMVVRMWVRPSACFCWASAWSSAPIVHGKRSNGLWFLPAVAFLSSRSQICPVLMLPDSQSCFRRSSGWTSQVWGLCGVAHVPIWSTICQMLLLPFCDRHWSSQQAPPSICATGAGSATVFCQPCSLRQLLLVILQVFPSG